MEKPNNNNNNRKAPKRKKMHKNKQDPSMPKMSHNFLLTIFYTKTNKLLYTI